MPFQGTPGERGAQVRGEDGCRAHGEDAGLRHLVAIDRGAIAEGEDVSLVIYPATKNLLEVLFDDGSLPQAKVAFDGFDLLKSADRNLPALLEGGMLAVAPYAFSIR